MIKYNPKDWFGLIFQFHKSDTFSKMGWVLLIFAVYTALVVFLELHFKDVLQFKSTIQVHSLLGFVLALLLVFRTNSAYDRWWEGRKQWGAMVNNTRNFAIKLNALLPAGTDTSYWQKMIPNYVFAMKEHLREGVKNEELNMPNGLEHLTNKAHVPNAIVGDMYKELHALYNAKIISGDQLITIDKELKSFTDIIGACERIKKTPIPYSYSLFLKKFIFLYVITIPFGMVYDFNYWTIPIATVILYVLGSIELIAEEIEDPFGVDANDLPTDDLAVTIKGNVKEILG
ncbi:MAG: bestrophin family ion channel [Vicingaceae bacterium]|nr:bestrophin family ion channel [Vicingaceae bacterium]